MTRHVWVCCKNRECHTVFQVHGKGPAVCPDCATPYAREPEPNYLQLQARVYGTDAVPKWNLGLGARTAGKKDYERIAKSKNLIPAG